LEILEIVFRKEKEMKNIKTRKKEVRLSLFTDDMIPYIERPKDSTKRFLEVVKKFSTLAIYKINIQNKLSLYTTIVNLLRKLH
jgi:hypothetical protein